ncbi:S-adenosyl-L-methionine-dependent methyltransferase [Xylona heveae TC161]|uniref:S-adenosyl-L-methionine-dependent methyltransferase n=1 Tax=Xylona heveae (strain CBS 132557 / TC161) TaxID=1328760 RepID=A0A165ING3_XYLHT|nr:S-adenosyl-L-methionine-dependent methyltransferase [Xylona heveae TC161]KZF25153.1 S-adenosyl-L-methionine-dependent methyltransferase [Xylona heveae TC161]
MGKRGGKNFRGKRGGGDNRGSRSGPREYAAVQKQNEKFERFYNELGIVEDVEREEFWTALRRELPNSFRFTGSRGHALAVQQRLIDHYIPEITAVKHFDEPVEPPKPVSWFPDQLAWAMTTPKNVIRRFPPFASFQKFLVSETSVGNISRQEVVSMIPPLLMDLRPGMTVLDLCAAPGSKSAQLIELVHGGEEARVRKVLHQVAKEQSRDVSPDGAEIDAEQEQIQTEGDWSDDGRSTGLLIANDSDYKRSQMLVHQVKRLNSPNLIVTNHDAIMFPSIKIPSDPAPEGQKPKNKYLKFDRILADVPCSGDGTCRKNPNVWKDWIPGNGLGLYVTQVRILVRALQMLKVGGKVVYSTCSMNSVENEAVVSSAIDRCGGSAKVSLLDCSDKLPGLKRRAGLNDWKVMDKQGRIWNSWKEVEEAKEKEGSEGFGRLTEGMFPLEMPEGESRPPLERCLRVYPHLQDTGGFFICVLEKLSEIKARPEGQSRKTEPTPPVIAAVNEIAARPTNEKIPTEKINALDELAPPIVSNDVEDPTAAMRQNEENTPSVTATPAEGPSSSATTPATKHGLEEDESDAQGASKRVKVRDEPDAPAAPPATEAGRLVHYPPPPAAVLAAPAPAPAAAAAAAAQPDTAAQPPKKKPNQPYEEPFKYLDPEHPELQKIYGFYSLSPRFPRDRFMVRNATGEPVKAIYYSSSLARDILRENEGKGIKFVHCGIKMFMKQDVQKEGVCRWRIQAEGLPILEAWVGDQRVVRLYKRETLRKLLVEMFPAVTGKGGDGWKQLGEIGERVRDIGMGCCVLRVETSDDPDGFKYVFVSLVTISFTPLFPFSYIHSSFPLSPYSYIPSSFLFFFILTSTHHCHDYPHPPPPLPCTCQVQFESDQLTTSFSNTNRERMVLPLWRSLHSLNLMLPKEERRAMLLRLYNDDSPLLDHSKDRFIDNEMPPPASSSDATPAPIPVPAPATADAGTPAVAAAADATAPSTEQFTDGAGQDVIGAAGLSSIEEAAALKNEDAAMADVEHEAATKVDVEAGIQDEDKHLDV